MLSAPLKVKLRNKPNPGIGHSKVRHVSRFSEQPNPPSQKRKLPVDITKHRMVLAISAPNVGTRLTHGTSPRRGIGPWGYLANAFRRAL